MSRRLAMIFGVLPLLAVGCGSGSGTGGQPAASQEDIMGAWVVESAEAFGRPVPTPEGKGMKLEFRPEKAVWRFQNETGWRAFDGKLRHDPTTDPKRIDLVQPDRPDGSVASGIYTFRGGQLIIAMGAERPKSFDEPCDAKLILKRE
jgi:uncharacterized protein (TIGR03067 family)